MFAGHVGAALAIGRAERRVNVGAFVFAAVLLDVVLWLLVLLGWESVTIPANFASTHQPEFVFPYSHGLLASIAWSALAGVAIFIWYPHLKEGKSRAAGLVAHGSLLALASRCARPCTRVAGRGRRFMKVGLGLWHSMPVALAVEALMPWLASTFSCPALVCRACKEALAHGTFSSHPRLHRGWNDHRTTSALGRRYGCEFIGHRRCGMRACRVDRKGFHMKDEPDPSTERTRNRLHCCCPLMSNVIHCVKWKSLNSESAQA